MKGEGASETRDMAEAVVEGEVERVVYSSESTGWTVAGITHGRLGHLTAVGVMPGLAEGQRVRLEGKWRVDPRYGEQFAVASVQLIPPSTRAGIKQYLSSGCFPGVGEVMAARLVAHFGDQTLEVIRDDPGRLREVEGVGPKRAEGIRSAWQQHRGMHDAMVFLRSYGIASAQALKIYKRYGSEAINAVRENPYRLALDITGVGFVTADRIAAALGVAHDSPRRAQAAVVHRLGQLAEEGHVYFPRQRLAEEISDLFGIDLELTGEAIAQLGREGRVVVEAGEAEEAVFLAKLHAAEVGSADLLLNMLKSRVRDRNVEVEATITAFEKESSLTLASNQRQAVRDSLSSKIMILTGGPGTGKTTIIRAIVSLSEKAGLRVSLAAPTGRAARRLADSTGYPARTIHRLLEFNPREGVFGRSEDYPIEADLLIIDEASMIDCSLFFHILRAISQSSSLILVGDVDQLPSVGPGSVLKDLIACGLIKVARLGEIFRQAEDSLIVRNAHLVNKGVLPGSIPFSEGADFFFVEREDPRELLETLKVMVAERIPKRFGVDPLTEMQVLSPMHRGLLGTINLNRELRALLNPAAEQFNFAGRSFAAGDKVMQIRNNYEIEVFNGDIGVVIGRERGSDRLTVAYDGRVVGYESTAVDEITLAYSCSVHKSQGSEFPAVVLVLHTQHYPMLQRNLLYTAITRGQRLVVLVGSKRALALAVNNDKIGKRYTRLRERLEAKRCGL